MSVAFWNFSHSILGMHVYTLPSILVGIAMLVAGLIHRQNTGKREAVFEEQLNVSSAEGTSSAENTEASS